MRLAVLLISIAILAACDPYPAAQQQADLDDLNEAMNAGIARSTATTDDVVAPAMSVCSGYALNREFDANALLEEGFTLTRDRQGAERYQNGDISVRLYERPDRCRVTWTNESLLAPIGERVRSIMALEGYTLVDTIGDRAQFTNGVRTIEVLAQYR